MTTPRAAAIYARISSDVEGLGAGVGRQVEDCRKLATSLGWTVSGEYVDNDVSAYSGKRRPDYERMLADLADGTVDAVLVYHIDRLTRRPIELEDFLSAVDRAKVRHVKFVTGDTDVHTGDGLLMARIMGAVAANKSASKSRRVRRKMEQVAPKDAPTAAHNAPTATPQTRSPSWQRKPQSFARLSLGSWPERAAAHSRHGLKPRSCRRSVASRGAPAP